MVFFNISLIGCTKYGGQMKFLTLKTVNGEDLRLSKIILGTAQLHGIWNKLGEEGTFAYIDKFRELGGDTIDTGRAYGGEVDQEHFGFNEGIISRYMKSRKCEKEIKVITKGGFPDLDVKDISNMIRFRINRDAILGDFYTSYDRLQKGPIDVWMLHRDDPSKPVSYIMDILEEIKQTGLVKVIGVSNWSMERILEANAYARSKGQVEIAVSEIMWSYAYTDVVARNDKTLSIMDDALYRKYIENPIPVVAFSSQARGLFSLLYNGTYTWDEVPQKNRWYAFPENEKRWLKMKEFCDKTGHSPAAVALAYLSSNKIDCAPIIGCMTEEEIADSLSNTDLTLTQEEIEWFDNI